MTQQKDNPNGDKPLAPEGFEIMVLQHIGWVYQMARRQLADADFADDAVQLTFLALWRRRKHVAAGNRPIGGWLVRATYYVCREISKSERRRQCHERKAAIMRTEESDISPETAPSKAAQLAALDSAMQKLSAGDRNMLVARFFQNHTARQAAQQFNISEAAAAKRTARAVGKLRGIMARQNVALDNSALMALLAGGAGNAPNGLIPQVLRVLTGHAPPNLTASRAVRSMLFHAARVPVIFGVGSAAVVAVAAAVIVSAVPKVPRTPAAPIPVFQSAVAKASTVPTRQAMINAVAARLTLLRNIVTAFDMDWNQVPPTPATKKAMKKVLREIEKRMQKRYPGVHIGHAMSGHYKFRCRFSRLLGRVLYEKTMFPETIARLTEPGGDNVGIVKQIRSYTPTRDEELNYNLHVEKHPFGVIQKALGLPMHLPIAWAMGLCPPFLGPPSDTSWHWIGRKQLGEMTFTRIGSDYFLLTEKRTSAASAYSSIEQKKVIHSIITFEYQWVYRWKPKLELRSLRVFITDPPAKHALCLIGRCSDFQDVSGLMLPGKVVETGFADPKAAPIATVTLTNLHYIDGDPINTDESYFIVFPVGSHVLDARSHRQFQIVTRPRRLTDQALAKLKLENNLRHQQVQP